MTSSKIEVDRLLIYDPDKSRNTCHIFISHPTPLEEKSLGKLFIIFEIDSQEKINQEIISLIQEETKNNFYHANDLNVETALESALQKTNEKLHHLISEGITNWLDKFNIVIAVVRGFELYFTHIGRMHTFLIQQERIVDILAQTSPVETKVNPLKIFSSVISGHLNPNDQLLFCTNSILDYFSQEKLKRVISASLPPESINQFEKILLEAETNLAFGAIVIKLVPQEDTTKKEFMERSLPLSKTAPQTSMNNLIRKEEKTSEYLTPSLWPNIVKSSKNYLNKAAGFVRTKIFKKTPKRRIADSPYYYQAQKEKKAKPRKIFSQIFYFLKIAFLSVVSFFAGLIQIFRRRKEMTKKLKDLPQKTENNIGRNINKFRNLSRQSKYILILSLVILFIFAQSIVLIGLNRDKKISQERKDEIIKEIKDKTFEAGAALTYEDESGAKALLDEANNLLGQLPDKSKDDKKIVSDLRAGINKQYEKTKHIINIENPVLTKDLKTLESQAQALGITHSGQTIYANNSNNEVYIINIGDGKTTTIENNLSDIGQIKLRVEETSSTILYYHDQKGIVEFNTLSEKFISQSIDFPESSQEIKALAVYRSRFYYLDTKNNQIYRFQRGRTGFGPGTAWIKESNLDIRNSVSFVIDGSIYLLNKDGTVWELFQGRVQDFKLLDIDPKLESAQKIWTDENSNYLYILDKKGKRIIQYDKLGNFKNQYFSDKFENLKDFEISEKDKKAWLLSGENIFEISLEI